MGEKIDAGEIYKGPCGVLKDSNWLSAESLPADKDTLVQIEAVVRRKEVKFKNETKTSYGSLRFKGAQKELGLNATHLKVLKALFGSDTTAWFGQWVALYVDPDVSAFGQIVSAVRIRAKKVEAPARAGATAAAKAKPAPSESDTKDDGSADWQPRD
jgi:hypothetical protein